MNKIIKRIVSLIRTGNNSNIVVIKQGDQKITVAGGNHVRIVQQNQTEGNRHTVEVQTGDNSPGNIVIDQSQKFYHNSGKIR